MSSVGHELATTGVVWRRDLVRFARRPVRLLAALGLALVLWLVLGAGLAQGFQLPGVRLDYAQLLFPGVVVLILLFASSAAVAGVIEDRHQGFLQVVLAGPGSRVALVAGKCAGAASLALLQAAAFLCLVPLAGFAMDQIHWPTLIATGLVTAAGLSAMSFALAWWLDDVPAYQAVQLLVLVPAWVVSGAMFPVSEANAVFAVVSAVNPLAYSVSALRAALHGGAAPVGTAVWGTAELQLAVVAAFSLAMFALAVHVSRRVR